jgi:hypothetical protein
MKKIPLVGLPGLAVALANVAPPARGTKAGKRRISQRGA